MRLKIVQFNAMNEVKAACFTIQRQFQINHYKIITKEKKITREETKNGLVNPQNYQQKNKQWVSLTDLQHRRRPCG